MDPLLLSPEQAFKLIGVGRSHGFKLLANGDLPSIKIGRLRRIPRTAIEQWIKEQTQSQTEPR